MQFQLFHNKFFSATNGSYSIVTPREEYDSQITLTDFEADMVIKYFGSQNIHIGNVASDRKKSAKQFLLYPSYKVITLNLVFPKPHKHELRLYISHRAGFKPIKNEVWFLFITQSGAITIGALPQNIWNALDQEDPEDSVYLEEIEDTIADKKIQTPPVPKIVKRTVGPKIIFERNPEIAAYSLMQSKFICDVDGNHKTFIALKNNKTFVEAHHFVPMKFQNYFNFPLDCVDNIISLCPNCHRGIHLGVIEHKKNLIDSIYKKRGAINKFNVADLYSFYNLLKP